MIARSSGRVARVARPISEITSILVDVDACATSQPALDQAIAIARWCGARLRIVDVASVTSPLRVAGGAQEDELRERRHDRLARLVWSVGDVVAAADVLTGLPVDALIADVERHGHDLVIRSHTRDFVARGHHSHVDVGLVRRCPCPVWALGAGAKPQHPRIVAAVDSSTTDPIKQALNRRVVEMAVLLTQLQRGTLALLQAWQVPAGRHIATRASGVEYSAEVENARRRAREALERFAQSFGRRLVGTPLDLRRGRVESILPTYVLAEGVDLVVMGAQARLGIMGHLVSGTAERLLDRLPCSLLAVKPAAAAAASLHDSARS